MHPVLIALLGAESTGKTSLSQTLAQALRQRGLRTGVTPEVLREWCNHAQRTPLAHEQGAIAYEQARRALAPSPELDVLIADTTPLMTAVYSEVLFADRSLHAFALTHQRHYAVNLVMGLDMPWTADGLQRDGSASRAPVDASLRTLLAQGATAYSVIYGMGQARTDHALQVVLQHLTHSTGSGTTRATVTGTPGHGEPPAQPLSARVPGCASCEDCADAANEQRLFSDLLNNAHRDG